MILSRYMHLDKVECRVPIWGDCDLDLWVKGQILDFFVQHACPEHNLKTYMHDIGYIHALGLCGVSHTKMMWLCG